MRKTRAEHGLSGHPLYQKWQDMVRRCHSPSDQRYPWYGAKGITVCLEWREDPAAFIKWCLDAGWLPGMEIDKDIKVPGNTVYGPTVCSIVTHQQNMLMVVGRQSGKKSTKLKLSVQDVQDIKTRRTAGESIKALAAAFSVDRTTISRAYKA